MRTQSRVAPAIRKRNHRIEAPAILNEER